MTIEKWAWQYAATLAKSGIRTQRDYYNDLIRDHKKGLENERERSSSDIGSGSGAEK